MNDFEINKELKEIQRDRRQFEKELKQQRYLYANLLLNGMGDDIHNVLSGKVKVTLTWKEKLRYKFRFFKNKIKKLFNKE